MDEDQQSPSCGVFPGQAKAPPDPFESCTRTPVDPLQTLLRMEDEGRGRRENVNRTLWKTNSLSYTRSNNRDPLQTWLDKVMREGFLKERVFF